MQEEKYFTWVLHINPEYFGLMNGFVNCIFIRAGVIVYHNGESAIPMPDFRTAANRLIDDTVKATLLSYAKI